MTLSCMCLPYHAVAWGSAETCADNIGNTQRHPEDVASQLVDWLRENGAYINEKLVVRQLAPDDPTSPAACMPPRTWMRAKRLRDTVGSHVEPSKGASRGVRGQCWIANDRSTQLSMP
ncbi:hypothetical protein ACHAW5_009382 [Stephanodiscus triporus]|uniref:Uncharacterized protein n=1 Tax=Stephanodiscus triporus TaxID=2934178 RepID=A0ABD3P7J1_9STRA